MIDDGIASELGAEYALRVEDQMKVKHNAYGMKPQASGLRHRSQLHPPIWIKKIHLFWSPHQRTLTDRFGVYPSGNNIDSSPSDHFEAARFLRWGHPTSSRHSTFPGAHMFDCVVGSNSLQYHCSAYFFFFPNFAYNIAILVEREVQSSTYDDRRCAF
jgi:hypothetical protein